MVLMAIVTTMATAPLLKRMLPRAAVPQRPLREPEVIGA